MHAGGETCCVVDQILSYAKTPIPAERAEQVM